MAHAVGSRFGSCFTIGNDNFGVSAAVSDREDCFPASGTADRAAREGAVVDEYLGVLRRLGRIRSERTTRAHLEDLFRHVDFTNARMLDVGGGEGLCSFYAAVVGAREVVCL